MESVAETELLTKFPYGGVVLRPGSLYGTRCVGSMKLPLGAIGSPLVMSVAETELLTKFPYGGVVLRPESLYGTRCVGSMKLPLGAIGSPLVMCYLNIYSNLPSMLWPGA